MTKLTPVKRESAIGMLQATMTPSVVAEQFRCHVRMIGCLKNRFQQTWTTSDRPRPGRHRVVTRRQDRDIQTSHLCNRFNLETVTARTGFQVPINRKVGKKSNLKTILIEFLASFFHTSMK